MNKRCFTNFSSRGAVVLLERPPGNLYSIMDVDVLEMVAQFMESQDDTDMVRKIRPFWEDSWGIVLRC
jgi:hypothetical protein